MPTVRTQDADISYEITGEGDPLLLIMGLGTDSRMWMMQVPAFANTYKVITLDNRGVGKSSTPPGPYTMEQMASDALAVLDAAGAERAHVVGISMGGAIAQHLALLAPERVRSLVLAATWAGKNSYFERMTAVQAQLVASAGREALIKASMLWLFTPKMIIERPDMVSMVEQAALRFQAPLEGLIAQGVACGLHDVRDRLPALRIPTLVMVGRRDTLVPPELSDELAALIPGAQAARLETAHAFNIEETEVFNRTVLEFVGRIG